MQNANHIVHLDAVDKSSCFTIKRVGSKLGYVFFASPLIVLDQNNKIKAQNGIYRTRTNPVSLINIKRPKHCANINYLSIHVQRNKLYVYFWPLQKMTSSAATDYSIALIRSM